MWKKVSKVCMMAAIVAAASLPVSAASYYTVGSKGDDVKAIQKQLRKLGYDVNTNGVYTKDTADAVSKYQKDKKIEVSGRVGGWTYYLLTGKRTMLSKDDNAKTVKNSKSKYANIDNGGRDYKGSTAKVSKWKQFSGSNGKFGQSVVSSAYEYLGVPYVFGGNTPDGFDCSGFTKYVFSHNGIELPRMADEQYEVGDKVKRSELVPGDLVFFTTYEPGISHTGIYVGNNNFISATSSGGIRVDSLDSSYWGPRYVGATRVRK